AGAAGGRAGTGGTPATGGSGGAVAGGQGPCDIYKAAGNPCIAAHSTVRALFGAYGGKLYQVRNSAGATKDILAVAPGGAADGPSQDAFCMGTTCVITVLYDQSGKGNDLWYQGSTMVPASTSSSPSKATSESLTLGGHKVYSLYINPGNSYWVDASKSGIALGAQPEGMYTVTSGKHYNSGCCFDYGNSETDRKADGSGAMDALNLSSITAWGTGAGNGPWVMADLEYGVFAQNNTQKNQNDPSQTSTYVTAVLKNNGTTEFALRGGDAAAGNLGTYYKGSLPGGWSPMKKQGAIVLGSGGDCCKPGGGANASDGTFYEGAIVTGYPTDATEDAIQANIVAAGYGK
ncbi:MAG TPA: arabinofuranosidase catalytic domain-containing protein, partial [Polyangia bacterium]|nr:arabinofuranosidase catalytic domain-containing protein [Polyangia bacterium]